MLQVPVHKLADHRGLRRGGRRLREVYPPGERFTYCNAGYVVLALIAERVSVSAASTSWSIERVCRRAGLMEHGVPPLRRIPARTALGYVESTASGRATSSISPCAAAATAASTPRPRTCSSFWRAFFAGRIVSTDWVSEMVRPRSDAPKHSKRYGLGFWLHASNDAVLLEGYDAGVSFRSVHDPRARVTLTVISNTSDGAWPIARYLENAASS